VNGIMQAGVKYHSFWDKLEQGFHLEVTTVSKEKGTMIMDVSIRYDLNDESGMAVATIHLLSGHKVGEVSLARAQQTAELIYWYEKSGRSLNIYFQKTIGTTMTFSITLHYNSVVGLAQPPVAIEVYDYYNPDVRSSQSFKLKPTVPGGSMSLPYIQGSYQCFTGKCPYCYPTYGFIRADHDSSPCKNMDTVFGRRRRITLTWLIDNNCAHAFAYKFRVTQINTDCNSGLTKVVGYIEKTFRASNQTLAVGDKIKLWKVAVCSCPSFQRGQSYLYVGDNNPLVDLNVLVLKWIENRKGERKFFESYSQGSKKQRCSPYD
jgi:hypothetical protein